MASRTYAAPLTEGLERIATAPVRALLRTVDTVAGATAAAEEIERLTRLSDDQLAARGLDRDTIIARALERHMPR